MLLARPDNSIFSEWYLLLVYVDPFFFGWSASFKGIVSW
jgi:hypothetical protein